MNLLDQVNDILATKMSVINNFIFFFISKYALCKLSKYNSTDIQKLKEIYSVNKKYGTYIGNTF